MTRLWLVAAAGVLLPVVGGTRIYAGEDAVEQLRKQVVATREQANRTTSEIRRALELARMETPAGLAEASADLQQTLQQLEEKLGGSPDAEAQASIREGLARTRQAMQGLHWTLMAAHILQHLPERSIAIQDREMVKRYEAMLCQRLAAGVARTEAVLAGKSPADVRDRWHELNSLYQMVLEILGACAAAETHYPALAGKPVLQEYRGFGAEFTKARQQDIQRLEKEMAEPGPAAPEGFRRWQRHPGPQTALGLWRQRLSLEQERENIRQNPEVGNSPAFQIYSRLADQEIEIIRQALALAIQPDEADSATREAYAQIEKHLAEASQARQQARQSLEASRELEQRRNRLDEALKRLPEAARGAFAARIADSVAKAMQCRSRIAQARAAKQRMEQVQAEGDERLAMLELDWISEDIGHAAEEAEARKGWEQHKANPALAERIKQVEAAIEQAKTKLAKKREAERLAAQLETRRDLLELKAELTQEVAQKLEDEAAEAMAKAMQAAEEVREAIEEMEQQDADKNGVNDREALEKEAGKIPDKDPVEDKAVF